MELEYDIVPPLHVILLNNAMVGINAKHITFKYINNIVSKNWKHIYLSE
jgi:hypothetical protein